MKLIFFGPPGAGKGTYSIRISERLGIPHISTGDMFRAEIAKGSRLGNKVKEIINKGNLVPDDITIEIVKKRIAGPDAQKGFILDGFPRTIEQARGLETITKIDKIVNLIVPHEILIEKMLARRICRKCGDIYNIADIHKTIDGVEYILPPMNPKIPGKCDKCGNEIYRREDETEEVIRGRFEVYDRQSKPLLDYFKGKVPFINIHVTRGPDVMTGKIMEKIKK